MAPFTDAQAVYREIDRAKTAKQHAGLDAKLSMLISELTQLAPDDPQRGTLLREISELTRVRQELADSQPKGGNTDMNIGKGEVVRIQKSVTAAEAPLPVKDRAWAQIEAGAVELMKADAKLTIHKARDQYMQTAEGRAQLELYHHPDAHLSAAKFVERQEILAKRETGTGRQRWDQVVTDIAKAMAAKHGVNFHEGLQLVEKYHPAIYGEYLAEREGRGLVR